MKTIKIFTLLFVTFAISLYSCKSDKNLENNSDSLIVTIVDTLTVDTISNIDVVTERTITDTIVLFFMPSPQERQELLKFYGTYSQYEFQAIFNNFTNLSRSVKNAMWSIGITVEVTYAKKFVFPMQTDTMTYDLENENQLFGYILSDGVNYPLIKNGVQRTKDVSNDIRNFYNISNFSIAGQ